jgi:hypothetical protein
MITKKTSKSNEKKIKKKLCRQLKIIFSGFKAFSSETDFCVFSSEKVFSKNQKWTFFFCPFFKFSK